MLRLVTDREPVYRLRHDVFATELRQHPENGERRLTDDIDAHNVYIGAYTPELVGFVSVTPAPPFAVEKYYTLPFDREGVFETRLLAVHPAHRGDGLVAALAYAAYEWATQHGARRIVTNAHPRMVGFYRLAGMTRTGLRARCGELDLELMVGDVDRMDLRRLTAMLPPVAVSARDGNIST